MTNTNNTLRMTEAQYAAYNEVKANFKAQLKTYEQWKRDLKKHEKEVARLISKLSEVLDTSNWYWYHNSKEWKELNQKWPDLKTYEGIAYPFIGSPTVNQSAEYDHVIYIAYYCFKHALTLKLDEDGNTYFSANTDAINKYLETVSTAGIDRAWFSDMVKRVIAWFNEEVDKRVYKGVGIYAEK